VRSKLAIDQLFKERGYAYQAQVAFSGTVRDGGQDYTEPGMNGLPEVQTAKAFERPEYRFLIVANKFQTGFDQPLLHTMYVDKRLGGVNAVQTLSRLNRIYPDKIETMVLDFANEADAIQKAFASYYEKTLLSESTDPHLLYDLERRLLDFHVYDEGDINTFAALYFRPKSTQDQLYSALAPSLERYQELPEEERVDFRGQLTDYVRLYAFLAQILTFVDADLEKLYVFARLLRRYLPPERAELPREIQQNVDMDSYRVQPTAAPFSSNVAKGNSTHNAPRTSISQLPTPSSHCRRLSMTSTSVLAPTFPKKTESSSPTWYRSSPETWHWRPVYRSTPRKTPG
jgi:type I restriction enzyme, R subunit